MYNLARLLQNKVSASKKNQGEYEMKKLLLIFTAMLLLLIAACGGAENDNVAEDQGDGADVEVADEDLFITIATGGTSGVYYPIGGALSNLIEKNLNFDTSVQATGALLKMSIYWIQTEQN